MIKFYLRVIYYEIIGLFFFHILRSKKKHIYQIIFSNYQNLLNSLCIKYGTDKGFDNFNIKKFFGKSKSDFDFCYPHIYSKFYNDIFYTKREKIKLVFECGIGEKTQRRKFLPGASLKVWREYFPNAKIYGADINNNLIFQTKNIKTFQMDQRNKKSISYVWKKINKKNFDIIIDDGLHNFKANKMLLINSFKFLKKNGVYIIEDIQLKDILLYNNFLSKKKFKYEIVHFNNQNYSNHCLIKIVK